MARRETAWVVVLRADRRVPKLANSPWIGRTRRRLLSKMMAEEGFAEDWRPVKVHLTLATGKAKRKGKR